MESDVVDEFMRQRVDVDGHASVGGIEAVELGRQFEERLSFVVRRGFVQRYSHFNQFGDESVGVFVFV